MDCLFCLNVNAITNATTCSRHLFASSAFPFLCRIHPGISFFSATKHRDDLWFWYITACMFYYWDETHAGSVGTRRPYALQGSTNIITVIGHNSFLLESLLNWNIEIFSIAQCCRLIMLSAIEKPHNNLHQVLHQRHPISDGDLSTNPLASKSLKATQIGLNFILTTQGCIANWAKSV